QPSVALFQGDDLIANATASAPNGEVVLQTVRPGEAGTPGDYRIEVGGANDTTGPYTVLVILNAAVEDESHGGPANDTPASAQDLEPTFLRLPGADVDGGPERGAVLGQVGTPTDQDFYGFTLQAGESATLALSALHGGSAQVELQSADGTRLALGRAG